MAKYSLVKQEDTWGCGVACIASLLGKTYQESLAIAEAIKGKKINARPSGLELRDLVKILASANIKVVADWNPKKIPNGTIAFVAGGKRYGKDGHYILKTPKGWMDPWHNLTKDMKASYRDDYPRGSKPEVFLIPTRS